MKNTLAVLALILLSLDSYSQQISNDTIHWSESRKLEWKYFAGKADGKEGILGQTTMMMNAEFRKGFKATTSIETLFDRKSSFVSAEGKTPQQLKYFQTMFDLYEVESRKLRKEFKTTKFGLDPDKVFQEKYNAALKALSERVDNYMEETAAGNEPEEVAKWSKTLKAELKELDVFSERANSVKK
jgi:hypothetical protein